MPRHAVVTALAKGTSRHECTYKAGQSSANKTEENEDEEAAVAFFVVSSFCLGESGESSLVSGERTRFGFSITTADSNSRGDTSRLLIHTYRCSSRPTRTYVGTSI